MDQPAACRYGPNNNGDRLIITQDPPPNIQLHLCSRNPTILHSIHSPPLHQPCDTFSPDLDPFLPASAGFPPRGPRGIPFSGYRKRSEQLLRRRSPSLRWSLRFTRMVGSRPAFSFRAQKKTNMFKSQASPNQRISNWPNKWRRRSVTTAPFQQQFASSGGKRVLDFLRARLSI